MKTDLRVIDRTPVYYDRRLISNSQFEFWLQHSIIDGDDFKVQLQEMVDNKSILNCSIDTFQLIADFITGKISKRNGRPKINLTNKLCRTYTIIFEFDREINNFGKTRLQAIDAIAKRHGLSMSEVDKTLKSGGRGVRNSRRKH